MHIKELLNFPSEVQSVLLDLQSEIGTKSIWFIGSRANNTYRDESDWDFICFIDGEISETTKRGCTLPVDIIQVDSKGNYLLEGKGTELMGNFDKWYWSKINNKLASYKVRKTPQVDLNGCFNISEVKILKLNAHQVWQRNAYK